MSLGRRLLSTGNWGLHMILLFAKAEEAVGGGLGAYNGGQGSLGGLGAREAPVESDNKQERWQRWTVSPRWLSRATRRDGRNEGPARVFPHARMANLLVTLCQALNLKVSGLLSVK